MKAKKFNLQKTETIVDGDIVFETQNLQLDFT